MLRPLRMACFSLVLTIHNRSWQRIQQEELGQLHTIPTDLDMYHQILHEVLQPIVGASVVPQRPSRPCRAAAICG